MPTMSQESEFDVDDIDFSVIRTAIKCGGTMLEQILNGVHYGTSEVRCLVLDECDLIIECKVCRNLFRALPNFIAHKRVYCLDAFQHPFEQVRIPVAQEEARDEEVVVIVEPVAPEESPVISDSRVDTKRDSAIPGAGTNSTTGSLQATIEKLKNGTFEGKSEAFKFYSNAAEKVADEEQNKRTRYVRHEPIPGNSNAVRVSVVDQPPSPADLEVGMTNAADDTDPSESMDAINDPSTHADPNVPSVSTEKPVIQPLVRSARIRAKSVPVKMEQEKTSKVVKPAQKEVVSETGKPSPVVSLTRMNLRDRAKKLFLSPIRRHLSERKDCDLKTLTCLHCKTKYSTPKSLQYHMNSYHANTRRVFPCSFCNSVFLHFWGLTRHLGRTHNKNKKQIAKMRENLKKLAYDKPIDNFIIGPGARLTILNDTEIAVVKNESKKRSTTKSPDVKKEPLPQSKDKASEIKTEKSKAEKRSKAASSRDVSKPRKETVIVSNQKRNASDESTPPKNISKRRRDRITASDLVTKAVVSTRKTTLGRSCEYPTGSKAAPQFSSGLSLLQCDICGKAFAKKKSLESHSTQCNKSQQDKRQANPDLPGAPTRKSSRRQQMSPTKIERADEDSCRKEGITSHMSPGKIQTDYTINENRGKKKAKSSQDFAMAETSVEPNENNSSVGRPKLGECEETEQSGTCVSDVPAVRKSNRRRQSSPMKIETRRRLSSPKKIEKNVEIEKCVVDDMNSAELVAAAVLEVEIPMEMEELERTDHTDTSVFEEHATSGEENVALITDEELLLLQKRLESQLDDQIAQVSQEMLGSPSDDDSEKEVRVVEEIWVTKSPGQPTEKVKSNRVYVMDSRGRNRRRGRPHCQDTRKIDVLIDENNLKCLHCNDLFGCVSNLRRHAIRHLGWKRYQCKLCRYSCYNKSECKSHLVRIHSSRTKNLSSMCLDHCILDLTKEASKLRSQKKQQTLSSRHAADASQTSPQYNTARGTVRAQSQSPNRTAAKLTEDRKKPAVSELNIADPDPKRFNISTRNSPRVFDTRPCATVDNMQTLFTRKGYYLKYQSGTSETILKKTRKAGEDIDGSQSKDTEGSDSQVPVTKKRFKTRSIDFRKPNNLDSAAIKNRYRRWSESRLQNCRRELQKLETIGLQVDDDDAGSEKSVVLESETHPSKNIDVIDIDGENDMGNVPRRSSPTACLNTNSPQRQSGISGEYPLSTGNGKCGVAMPSPSCGSEANASGSELPAKPDTVSAGRDLSKMLANEMGTNTP